MRSLMESGQAGAYVALEKTDPKIAGRKRKGGGEAAFDAALWSAFLAFDIIGDLVSYGLPVKEWVSLLTS